MNLEKYNGCARKKTNDGKLVGHQDTCLSVLRLQKETFFIQKMFLHAQLYLVCFCFQFIKIQAMIIQVSNIIICYKDLLNQIFALTFFRYRNESDYQGQEGFADYDEDKTRYVLYYKIHSCNTYSRSSNNLILYPKILLHIVQKIALLQGIKYFRSNKLITLCSETEVTVVGSLVLENLGWTWNTYVGNLC